MFPRYLGPIMACCFVAACTMEAPQGAAQRPAPAPQAAIMPSTATPTARVTDSSSTTTTTVQGNTTRTETSSSSVSVDASALLGALAGGAAPAANTAADYSGTWRVSSPGNSECRLNLQAPANPAAPAMVQNMGCFNDLFHVSRWSLRGNDLVLTDAFGNVNITLRATARNRLDGGGVTMWR